MRVVGKRPQYDITFDASAEKLVEGARWNDAMNATFGHSSIGVFPKGVYCYRSHEEADAARLDATVARMASIAVARRRG
jgi:hypothetical protein